MSRHQRANRRASHGVSLSRGAWFARLLVLLALAGCAPAGGGAAPLVRLDVGENLGTMAAAGHDVWVNDFGREQLVRLDGRSGRVLERLPLGRRVALASSPGSVWALVWGGRFFRTPNGPLYRIDARTGRVIRRIPLDPDHIYFGVLANPDDVWIWGPRHLVRIDPVSGFITSEYSVEDDTGELTGAVLQPDGVLASTADGRLLHIGPDGIRPGPRVPELARAELLAVDRGNALAAAAGALVAVDARTGRPRWRRPLGFRISTLFPREGILLTHGAAFHDAGDRLWAVDTATGRLLASAIVPSFGTTSMITAGGGLWFATAAGKVIVAPPAMVRSFLARARATRRATAPG